MTENVHDKGYKRLFSNKQFFRELVETFVTEDWVKDIDFNDCQKIDKSFVSAHYKETESDIIYKVKFKNEDAYIYLLLEFQSTVVWYMALRVLNYISNFYMDLVEEDGKLRQLPPVFPLVLYNGNETWTAKTDFRQLLEKPDLLDDYAPQLHYFKMAENEYDKDTLLEIGNLISLLFLSENNEDVEVLIEQLLQLFEKEEDKRAISILLNWFKQLVLRKRKSLGDYQQLEHVYHSLDEVKTMIDANKEPYAQRCFVKGEAHGIKKGIQQGIQQGIQKGSLNSLITVLEARFSPLSLEQKQRLFAMDEKALSPLLKNAATVENLAVFFNEIDKV